MAEARRGTRTRHATLLTLLHDGVTQVDELAARLDVSPSTVRRDLGRLTGTGQVARTYGGAMAAGSFHERPIGESAQLAGAAKAAIAATAMGLVPTSGVVFIDAGTTCGALARRLGAAQDREDLTVVTRGLETAVALADSVEVEVVLIGGRVRRLSHGLVGPLTDLALDRLDFDIAFLGADAVDPARGIGEPTLEETTVKERVAARARCVFVLADASKLSVRGTPAWSRLPSHWTLVTDRAAGADLEERCRDAEVDLLRA